MIFMTLAFAVLTVLMLWKSFVNFTGDQASNQFLGDLALGLLLPGACCTLLSVALCCAVTRSERNLPNFEELFEVLFFFLKAFRFLVALTSIVTLIVIGVKWQSSEEPQGLDRAINTTATEYNSTMCNFQVQYRKFTMYSEVGWASVFVVLLGLIGIGRKGSSSVRSVSERTTA